MNGPDVSETIYSELFRGDTTVLDTLDPDVVPYALDLAMQKLRVKGASETR